MTRRYVCTWCGANATPSDPKANAAAIQAHIRSCPKLAEHVAEAEPKRKAKAVRR